MRTKKYINPIRLEKVLLIIAAVLILAVLLTGLVGLWVLPSASTIWVWTIVSGLIASIAYTIAAFLFVIQIKDLKVNSTTEEVQEAEIIENYEILVKKEFEEIMEVLSQVEKNIEPNKSNLETLIKIKGMLAGLNKMTDNKEVIN